MENIKYKSKIEQNWASFFNTINWNVSYEKPTDQYGDWLPDFTINNTRKILVEVKSFKSSRELNNTIKSIIKNIENHQHDYFDILILGDGFNENRKNSFFGWCLNTIHFMEFSDLSDEFDYQTLLTKVHLIKSSDTYGLAFNHRTLFSESEFSTSSYKIPDSKVIYSNELIELWNKSITQIKTKNLTLKLDKPALAKGTRDFLPSEVIKRNYIFDTIKSVFKTYAYLPIETPAIELLSTLTGKYGEEGDQLLFKILNNGDYIDTSNPYALENRDSKILLPSISKRGLRYDLTVPLARYVSMHQNDIQFPFKRYAIQPVWRADRPQKGRYQEFYQCDADMVGSDSLMYEAELLQMLDTVYNRLNIDVIIKLNNRKILQGIAEVSGQLENFIGVTVAIDKLDKIGREKVATELTNLRMDDSAANTILDLIEIKDIDVIATKLSSSEIGMLGVAEMKEVMDYMSNYSLNNKIEFDFTLARGLSYYTGCIIEVVADTASYPDLRMGSISGGGRYADLTSMFGLKDMSGVGVSFGAERIYDVMEECSLFPESVMKSLDIFFVSFDDESHKYAYQQVSKLRAEGISADLYPEGAKMKKQMKYANGTGAPYVAVIGSDEMEANVMAVKEMATGDQSNMTIQEVIDKLK